MTPCGGIFPVSGFFRTISSERVSGTSDTFVWLDARIKAGQHDHIKPVLTAETSRVRMIVVLLECTARAT